MASFKWSGMDGANKYRIQVYGTSQNIVLDSVVSVPRLTYPLAGGEYSWRVRGENEAYTSAFSYTSEFKMIESDNLTTQQVLLSNPSDAIYTNVASLTFHWAGLNAALTYDFELVNVTAGNTIVNQQSGLTDTSVTLSGSTIGQEAEYQWKVRALNSTSTSNFTSRTFYIDKTNPAQPQNIAPVANAVLDTDQTLNFSWSIPADVGSVQSSISYTIEFSNDISFSSILFTSAADTNTYQHSFATTGTYYWRVKAKDIAGNTGIYSQVFKLTIQ
ncbi:hypothetical protein [Flavobacterium sp. 3HN19-14]|uniref:hypothetical protein n=1 Tax=Flavobacterium sp. 3HN19-14 TaxID=3448133 RepID=UPI003EDEEE77